MLTQVKDATVEAIRDEGDTPFVDLALTDASGNAYRATIGFWLDDAGDWKMISCEIAPRRPHRLARSSAADDRPLRPAGLTPAT